jgi:hypothetical protein
MRYLLIALSYVFAVPAIVCGEISERLRTWANKLAPPAEEDEDEWPSVRYDEWPADADRLLVLRHVDPAPVSHALPDRILEQHSVVKGTARDGVIP